jgi:DNA repair exonuclease SbcCD nuclease subunit
LVIAGHLGVSGSELSNQSILGQYVARSVLEAADCPVFLGHIHKSQKIGKQIFYAGSPWPLNYGENHLHGFYIHYLMVEGTMESTFVECSQRKIVPITIDLRADAKINLADVIKSHADEIKSNLVYLKLWPGPTDSSRLQAETEALLQRIAPYDFKIEVLREDTVVVRSPEIATAKTLRQKIQVISPEAPESVLEKADILEQESPEKLERQVQEL